MPSNTTWIIRDGKTLLVEVTETQLGQFGDREAAQATAEFHRPEFDNTIVRRDAVYGWVAMGQKSGRVVREVA